MTTSELRKIWIVHDIDETSVSSNGYKGTELELVIPEKIGTKKVTRIGQRAFRPESHKAQKKVYQNIKSVILPDSVFEIGSEAFEGCKELISISLPQKLRTIQYSCFANCGSLKEITIPESVGALNMNVFAGCKSLEHCILLSDETTITNGAFSNCSSLKELCLL
ncbi:MAG: leucine-rich repeat domain-containing protein [Parasporobacterium sp.]|nr:leucine-rich repeat domain-containing protein [Parasporobacterium sp.]